MSNLKKPISITLRPNLINKIDELARQVGSSRSELIGRLIGTFIDDLLEPQTAWVKIKRDDLFRTLEM